MIINPKSQKGAVTLVVLVTMLFLTSFLITMYIRLANKAGISAETTSEIAKRYNNINDINNMYGILVEDPEKNTIIPITNKEQLAALGSDTYVDVNGKMYKFSKTGSYVLQRNIDLGGDPEDEDTWWTPLTSDFTGVLDGLGYTISGLYINDDEAEEPQGLFGTLNGIVRNLNLENSSITGKQFVGAIAGINGEEALIENCYNKAMVKGTDYVGGIAGLNAVNEEDSTIHGTITNCKNIGNIIGDTHVTGGYFVAIDDNTYTPINNIWNKTRTLSANYKFISGEDDVAIIPKGFKVSANIDEQTISEGLVIQDSNGNEFVWVSDIEVSNENEFTGEQQEYQAMIVSIINNNGFYINKLEAEENLNITSIVVKQSEDSNNHITWEDNSIVVYLNSNIYTNSIYGLTELNENTVLRKSIYIE